MVRSAVPVPATPPSWRWSATGWPDASAARWPDCPRSSSSRRTGGGAVTPATRTEDGGEPPGTRLEASGFDLARAVASRRTADQLAAWTVHGDVAPYLPAFAGLGDLPGEPLPE